MMESMGGVKGANDLVDGMEQDATSDTAPARIALNQVAEIINVYIGVTQGKGMGLATGYISRGQGGWHSWHSGNGGRLRDGRRGIGQDFDDAGRSVCMGTRAPGWVGGVDIG